MAFTDGLPLDDVVATAIHRYAESRQALEAMLREGRQYGRQLGIANEDDVESIANGSLSLDQLRTSA